MDIVIEGNRINSVGAARREPARRRNRDRRFESHRDAGPDRVSLAPAERFGEAEDRAWLAFGITTVRSPGNTPYEGVEDREANDAGVRPGPRIFTAGYLMEWQRVYYKMGVAISGPAQLEMELERSKILQHDLIKSYVRLPDLQQKRVVEFAHGIGIPVATHEIYPAAFVGVDNTEHTAATSRRGYSPKVATLSARLRRRDPDLRQVPALSHPHLFAGTGAQKLFADDPSLKTDPRLQSLPRLAAHPDSGYRSGRARLRRTGRHGGQLQDGDGRDESRGEDRRRNRFAQRVQSAWRS